MNPCTEFASAIDDVALGAPPSRAFAAHVSTCAACTTRLERRRGLAARIDRALVASVRAEPPLGIPERTGARVSMRRPRRWSVVWIGVPAGLALVAGLLIFVSALGGPRVAVHTTDIAALAAWRSPTASLLVSRGSVLGTPFTLRLHEGVEHSRS